MTQTQTTQTELTAGQIAAIESMAKTGNKLMVWPEITTYQDITGLVEAGIVTAKSYGPGTYNHTDYFLSPEFGQVYKGFTQAQLSAAFDRVANPNDWRAPIDKVLLAERATPAVSAAVEFYTATQATITDLGNGFVRVTAVGYRMGPAGP